MTHPGIVLDVPLAELMALVAPGQPLPFALRDATGRLLLAAGKCVLDDEQMQALLERKAGVDPAEARAVLEARALAAQAAAQAGAAARPRTWFDEMEKQVWSLDKLLRGLSRGGTTAAQMEAFAEHFVALVEHHPDAALFLCVRPQDHRFVLYALTHALNTAAVSLLTARLLGWDAAMRRRAVLAGLSMNASIVELQAHMAEQKDPPSKRQLEQIRAHPTESARLLAEAGVQDEAWISAVHDHHERVGGAGYPRGLVEVGDVAHLLRAADVFCAKISPRALRPALAPQLAARQLFQDEKGGPVAAALIHAVGIYPPGDFVRLKNGESGLVLQLAAAGHGAIVVALFGADSRPLPRPHKLDTGLAAHAIAGPVADRSVLPRVLAEQFYGLLDLPPAAPGPGLDFCRADS